MPRKRKIKSIYSLPLAAGLPKTSLTYKSRYPLPHDAPIIVANGAPILGAGHISPTRPFIELSLSNSEIASLKALDATFTPTASQVSHAATTLFQHGVSLQLIARILAKPDTPTVSRLIALARHPDLLTAMDKGLSLGHARELLKIPYPHRTRFLEHALAHSLSVRQLKALISAKPDTADHDTKQIQSQLSEALSTEASLVWPQDGIKTLTLAYFTIEELQGTLENLLRMAGAPVAAPKPIKRQITIQITDTQEFEALLGNIPQG
jgi:hypothetical protein